MSDVNTYLEEQHVGPVEGGKVEPVVEAVAREDVSFTDCVSWVGSMIPALVWGDVLFKTVSKYLLLVCELFTYNTGDLEVR